VKRNYQTSPNSLGVDMKNKNSLTRKIKYLESMLEDIIGDAECPVKHQTSYFLNQIDYLKSRLIALEVDAVFNQKELEDESV
jgi:hypothetical protein